MTNFEWQISIALSFQRVILTANLHSICFFRGMSKSESIVNVIGLCNLLTTFIDNVLLFILQKVKIAAFILNA